MIFDNMSVKPTIINRNRQIIEECSTDNTWINMGGDLFRTKPSSYQPLKDDMTVWEILVNCGMTTFLKHCQGFKQALSRDIAMAWDQGLARVRELVIHFNEETLEAATGMKASESCIFREQKHTAEEMKQFRVGKEKIKKYQTAFERTLIPQPWYRVAHVLIQYITLEGHYKMVFRHHFALLSHFHHEIHINFPFFLLHSLGRSVNKVKKGRGQVPLHQGLIKLMVKWATPIILKRNFETDEAKSESDGMARPTSLLLPGPEMVERDSHKSEKWIMIDNELEVMDPPSFQSPRQV